MTSGRTMGGHNKKTLSGMTNLQILFKDKTNILAGMTKEEIISLYYNIPIKKVKDMKKDTIVSKWQEIVTIKKYLRKNKLCAIDFDKLEKGISIRNEECGTRKFDSARNIFFKISNITTADNVGKKYIKTAISFKQAAEDIHEIGEDAEKEIPIIEVMQRNNNLSLTP